MATISENGGVDIAVNLVESYLRLNGYLTLSEFEVQMKNTAGVYETLTDVDIVALRFPGDMYAADVHTDEDSRLLLIQDEELRLETDTFDLIIGEVKQGEAVFNPSLTRHEVLHTVLHRVGWIFAEGLEGIIDSLQRTGLVHAKARSGGHVRIRLVAFGRAPRSNINTITLSHMIETMISFMNEFDAVLRPAQFREPVPALLRLLAKTGFEVARRQP